MCLCEGGSSPDNLKTMTESIQSIINWAEKYLIARGYCLTGSSVPVQITSYSSVIRILTSTGSVYLKQNPKGLSLEPNIIQILHDNLQSNVPIILAINDELNCFLVNDVGDPLRTKLKQQFQPDLLWQAVKLYTQIQSSTTEHIQNFLELGVPDWRLKNFPSLYRQLIHKTDLLKADGLLDIELETLDRLLPTVSSLCTQLSYFKLPETLDHCDFHDNNILIKENTLDMTIIDWGECVITHPFFSLITCLNQATRHYNLKESDRNYSELQDACFHHWLNSRSKDDLLDMMHIAKCLWPIYSALAIHRLVTCANLNIEIEPLRFKGRLTRYLKDFIKINTQ